MKKIVTLILTMTLVISMNITAFAVGTGSQDISVKGRYLDNTTVPTVYSVDVTWESMEFTYTESGTMTWNPDNHTYADSTSGAWVANGNTVTVTNHSNANVTASFAFHALETYNTITGSFDIDSKILNAGIIGGYDNADKVVATLTLAGALAETATDFTKVGTITVTID